MKYVFLYCLLFIHVLFSSETNFIALDPANDQVILATGPSLDQQASPGCTFNIALSMIGYELQILRDQEQPVWQYDNSPVPLESHKTTHSPKTWMNLSVVWYSKKLAQIIGKESLQQYVTNFSYGNQHISDNFSTAHLASSLQISPREQTNFLKKIVTSQLPVSAYALQETKKLLLEQTFNSGWKLFGKTGTLIYENENNTLAWYVGWIEKDEQKYVFALLVKNNETFPTKEERQCLIKNFFVQSGIDLL